MAQIVPAQRRNARASLGRLETMVVAAVVGFALVIRKDPARVLALLGGQHGHCLVVERRADRALRLDLGAGDPCHLAAQIDPAPFQAQYILLAPAGCQRKQVGRPQMLGQFVVQPLGLPDGEPAIVLLGLAVLLQSHRRDMVEPSPAVRCAQDRAHQRKHLLGGATGGRALVLAASALHARLGHAEDQ
ncbi:hypothetical protein M0D44_19795 [Xanthomonas prunicola]|nr:hypothetical protein [Xanthomonas prunicola]UXA48487.1 hypothetical protein M0D44_19795 [Xanthomonas prunicola]